jgi:predicted DNA-binding transcriptional regulator YafY
MRDAIGLLFPQLEALADGRQKRFRIPGGLDSFLLAPTSEELAELDAAIATLEAARADARADGLRSLSRKIGAAQRQSVRRRLEPDVAALSEAQVPVRTAGIRPIINAEHLAMLRRAILEGRRVKLRYRAASGSEATRVIEPYGFLWGKTYYLVGPEQGHDEPVQWRLDRMADLELDAFFGGAPPSFSLQEFADRSFGAFQEPPEDICLRFDANVADAARQFHFHVTQQFTELDDGRLEVRFRAGGLLEIARHIFSWGGTAEIVGPPQLKALLRRELDAVSARHR